MAWKSIVVELIWFLRGDTNIKYLVDNGCHIWTGDAIKNYEKHNGEIDWGPYTTKEQAFTEKIKTDDEFAKKWGELGPIYGKQWRSWETFNRHIIKEGGDGKDYVIEYDFLLIDQIQNLINELKTNPDSRRLMVSAWNVGELDQMTLPPCHYGFQVYTRPTTREEKIINPGKYRAISLMFNMRSTDVGLGLGFNLASYGLLLMMIAKQVNMVPDELIYSGGDVHLYLNHIDPIKEQLMREPYPLSTVKLSDKIVNDISEYTLDDIILENYKCHSPIKLPLSN